MAAYKKQSSVDLVEDLHSRKEFAELWVPPEGERDYRDPDATGFTGVGSTTEMHNVQQFVRNFMNPSTPNMRMHLMHSTGCHAPGTLIRAYGCPIPRRVEDFRVGDCVVHPDGTCARIETLHHGFDEMYRIIPSATDRATYDVNGGHVLRIYDAWGVPIDLTVKEFLATTTINLGRVPRDVFLHYARANASMERARFAIVPIGYGEYYGFTLRAAVNKSNDALFLGADGLILHNSGKTRAAIAAAQEFIRVFRYIYRASSWRESAATSPSVFVIAFGGKHAFVRDLIKYPEFGYVSVAEHETYTRLAREAVESEEAYKKYSDFYSSLKRRTTARSKGGFYKMLGYDEFANRLFGSDVARLSAIIQEARTHHEPCAIALERAIAAGTIKVDGALMARLENSMIICDEIHNTYNSQTINNRGVALQYVLDHVRGLRFLSLSATPINSSPAEIADFINYFVEPAQKVMRESLFAGNVLLPGALERINDLLRGHISFLYDFDPHFFPKRIDVGVPISIADTGELPYLRFTPCVMSDFFISTIREFYRASKASAAAAIDEDFAASPDEAGPDEVGDGDGDDEVIGIPQNAYSLFDMVFPNPAEGAATGLFSSATLFSTIHNAPPAWKTQVGITTKIAGGLHTFGGPFLQVANLEKYSAKYAQMMRAVLQIVRDGGPTKIMIYHERVRMTGVILIREIMRENGVIDEKDEPTSGTLCAICARTRDEHTASSSSAAEHDFRPLRFVAMYSELDKGTLTSIRDRFNSPANTHGEWCSILIGSRLIRESYDFAAVRHLIILSLPVSISQLIQVFGRCVRRGSHLRLPENARDVSVHIFVNAGTAKARIDKSAAQDSPEIRRYALKLSAYLTMQKIEREMARNAVDAGINRNMITRPSQDSLGLLLYDEAVRFVLPAPEALRVDTFFAYGYGAREIQFAIDIIKRLFKHQSTWRLSDLMRAVRAPPFGVWSNPALISESSITIALSFLLSAAGNIVGMNDRAIVVSGAHHLIVASSSDSSESDDGILFLAPIESVEVAGITRSRALVDVESFIRGTQYESEDTIPIDQFELRTSFEESILAKLRADFKPAVPGKITTATLIKMRGFLTQFSTDQQRIVMQHFIEIPALRDEFQVLFKFLIALGLAVPFKYAKKYRDVARRFDEAFARRIEASGAIDDPIAFGDGTSVRLFTGTEWISISRSALNMHIEFNENDILVGIFKQFPYAIKFQLREPIQKLRISKGAHARDARTVERGSVCQTKPRHAIEQDARRLGIPVAEIRANETAGGLCDLIQVELLKREMKERADSHSLVKFVYGWWNTVPTPF